MQARDFLLEPHAKIEAIHSCGAQQPVIPTLLSSSLIPVMQSLDVVSKRAHYSPPWADVSIIGIAGSSGSGKSTLSHAIVSELNLPWVVILSMVGCCFLPVLLKIANFTDRILSTRRSVLKSPKRPFETNTTLTLLMP